MNTPRYIKDMESARVASEASQAAAKKENAFTMARPRGQDTAPSKAPRKTNHSRAPKEGSVHLLYDSNGRRTVSLAPRKSAIVIENREQRLANEAKLARLAGGVR